VYKFLMVDDEEIVRRGFEAKIDWAKAGFEFLPPCENGRDAMAAIDELAPDVVMTDIHMPHADGLSVAAHAAERHPETVVVILSGYDEFAYAQAAIRNKVYDYVLKPVSSRDLAALLVKIKGKLDSDRRSKEDETELRAKAVRSGDLERERGVAAILAGGASSPSASEAEAFLGFDPRPFACAAIVAECDLEAERVVAAMDAALRRARRWATLSPSAGRSLALVFEQGIEACERAAADVAQAILKLYAEGGGPEGGLRVGVGRAYARWTDAPRSRSEAEDALAYRLVRGSSRPYAYTQGVEDRESLAGLKEREERLCLGLRTGAAGRAAELARDYLAALGQAGLSPQRVRHEVLALFSRAQDELAGIGISSAFLSAGLGRDYYGFIEALDSPEAIEAAILRLAGMAAGALESSSLHEPEWKVLDFKELIARHYADKSLSIGAAAARLSISESYLSKLLRRKLGTSFVEYLSAYRIERAKELLAASDMRSYEVAEAVGLSDARYFASLFKKCSGMTPSEYRESMGRPSP
jgi:Response regulator containing CheY-like receiver domain and AraC-type DNA-binding domain